MIRGRPHPSAANKAAFVMPLQLTKKSMSSVPCSCTPRSSMIGSAMAMASATALVAATATATIVGVGKSSSSPSTSSIIKCESENSNVHVTMNNVSPWYQKPSSTITATTPVTMANSPFSSNAIAIHHAPTTQQHDDIALIIPAPTRRWWRFQWLRTNNNDRQPTTTSTTPLWWRRIGQSFFVITRGIEIAIRLSPLLILTPTAMIVSYIDTTWRRRRSSLHWYGIWKRNNYHNNSSPLTTSPLVLQQLGDLQAHDDIYTTQFQEETHSPLSPSSSSTTTTYHHHNHQTTTTTWASDLAWSYTLHTLQCLGPAFVKLGQWAATRRDLFPLHVCNRFAELHDTAREHDWKYTHQALIDAFGSDYEERGLMVSRNNGISNSKNITHTEDEDEEEGKLVARRLANTNNHGILGSGCAAQVHIGTLHNTTVAVKVLHPHTRTSIQRDLALLQHVADFIDCCIPLNAVRMLSLPRAVSNFASVMTSQVDLRVEGENLRVFRDNFGCPNHRDTDDIRNTTMKPHHQTTITFPHPESDWVSEHVLVEEYAGDDALPISRYLLDTSADGLKTRKELAGILLRAFLKMVFIDNFIHADLHPGNVLVRAVPTQSNPTQFSYTIIFIDAGIATSLQPNDKKNLHDLFKSIVLNDGYTAGQLMVERARYERCTSMPGGKHAFATGVADIVSEFHDRRKQGLTLGAVRVGALLGRVLDLCRRYQVEIDPAMSSVVVSMLVLEGLGRSLDPDLNLMKAAMPFLIGKV